MNHLIVARYNEDVGWLGGIEGWNPLVITKDVDIPNEGRECSSFMFGVASLYSELKHDDRVACVQGNPFDHCGDLNHELSHLVGDFSCIGNWNLECNLDGTPHHNGLPIAEYWEDWIGGSPPNKIQFTAGGQWTATGSLLLRRPVVDYQMMVSEMSRPKAPWVMERLWRYWFNNE